MSFTREYRPLFSVLAREEGTNLALAGFSFAPTSRCRRALRDHFLIFRPGESGFEVYYQRNPEAVDPLLGPITSRVQFGFQFAQAQTSFFDAYEPDLTADTGPQLYLDNLTAEGEIQPGTTSSLSAGTVVAPEDATKIYPPVFDLTMDLGGDAPPTTYTVRRKFDPTSVVLEVPIVAVTGADRAVTRVDLSGQPAGPYTLATDAEDSGARTIYVDGELAGAPILGLVDVAWETRQDSAPTGGVAYIAEFRRR
jgi:hypothetical protein